MDPLQTTYTEKPARAIEGMIANSEKNNIISRVLQSASMGFGKVAVRGTAENQCKVSEANGKFLGVSVLDKTQLQDSYPQYSTVAILEKGVIWVIASVQVAHGDPVYFVPATGLWTNVSNSSANTLVAGATWDTSTSGATQLARLRLR